MFATQTNKKTKTVAEKKPQRADAAMAKDSPEPNPVWQSLALSPLSIQRKLAISQPDDPYEQEADDIAEHVMRIAAPAAPSGNAESPPIVHEALSSPGQPLDPITRSFMEERLGHDFGHVRMHTDARAANAAAAIAARAFTVNRDIVFGEGEYAPSAESGRRLLSHELTHVVQQRSGVLKDGIGEEGDCYERHADDVAQVVAEGRFAAPLLNGYRVSPTVRHANGNVIQRQGAGHGLNDAYIAAPDATAVAGLTSKQIDQQLIKPSGDVYVQTFADMLAAARRPSTETIHIVGTGLEYFKSHAVTAAIRSDFLKKLEQIVENRKGNSGKLSDTYGAGLRVYGGNMGDLSAENLFSKGTWMIGKNDQPMIDYEVSYSRVATERWKVAWKAKWRIRDNLDLRGGSDQTDFYNKVAKGAGWLWHDVLGGKDPAPVHLDWEESGSFMTEPPLKATGTPIKSLRPGDVRQW